MTTVFMSYSHADETFRNDLEKQLVMMKRQGLIDTWHDHKIDGGQNIHQEISHHINTDGIILLLISPDFLASNYCYDIEMSRAIERHKRDEAIVIPVILRPCEWKHAPFGHLKATPFEGKPISKWPDRDEAYLDVATEVRKAVARAKENSIDSNFDTLSVNPVTNHIRVPISKLMSDNLRIAKTFTERDRDNFKIHSFEYIAKFFENSLAEIETHNAGIEGQYRRVDANRFFATIYRNGTAASRCTIFMGANAVSNGICYISNETTSSNSMNDALYIESDDESLFLRAMGMSIHMQGGQTKQKLSQEEASEFYWSLFLQPIKRR